MRFIYITQEQQGTHTKSLRTTQLSEIWIIHYALLIM
jgi:hypothetical protein